MASSQETQNRQLVKLECNLRTLSALTLSAEKKELLRYSMFSPLANITNKKESSSTLVAALSFLFDSKNQIFKFNEQLTFRFCTKEVAEALGINDAGTDFNTFKKKASKLSKKFPDALKKKGPISAANLRTILNGMSVQEDEEKVLFVKIFSFYVVEQFLLGGTDSKRPRCSFWSFVVDLKAFEDVNWAKSVCEHLMVAMEDLKKGLDADTNKTNGFRGCAPVLEAIIYKRIPSLAPKNGDLNLFPPIQKYSACRRDIGGWKFSHLTANDVEPCPHCTLPTPCSPPGSSAPDQVVHDFENMHVSPPPKMPDQVLHDFDNMHVSPPPKVPTPRSPPASFNINFTRAEVEEAKVSAGLSALKISEREAWVKAPLKKKQVVTKEIKALKAEQSQHKHNGSKGQKDCNLEKIVAARDEEIIRLKAELARKDKLLKAYESFLVKKEDKLVAAAYQANG